MQAKILTLCMFTVYWPMMEGLPCQTEVVPDVPGKDCWQWVTQHGKEGEDAGDYCIYRVSQKIYWLPLGLKIAFLWGQSFINNETIIECFKMFTFLVGYFRRKLNILFITLNPTIVATALWQIWKIPSPGKRPMFEPRKFRAT